MCNIMNILSNTLNRSSAAENYTGKTVSKTEYKSDLLDIFSSKVVNKQDITDTVTMPRTIFKGYLCFTAGTAVNSIGALIKNNKISAPFKIAGSILSIYGTYNFVKPYLIRDDELTKTKK